MEHFALVAMRFTQAAVPTQNGAAARVQRLVPFNVSSRGLYGTPGTREIRYCTPDEARNQGIIGKEQRAKICALRSHHRQPPCELETEVCTLSELHRMLMSPPFDVRVGRFTARLGQLETEASEDTLVDRVTARAEPPSWPNAGLDLMCRSGASAPPRHLHSRLNLRQ